MSDEIYRCPKGCETKKPITTLRGWKMHMNVMHGSYSEEQLATVTGTGGEGVQISGQKSFAEYAGSMPENASGLGREAEIIESASHISMDETEDAPPVSVASAQPVIVTPRRIKAKMQKLKKRIATDMPKLWFAKRGIPLDSEDTDTIEEAFDMMFDILDIGFEIQPWAITIRNRIVVFLYPLFVIGGIFVVKSIEQDKPLRPETKK